MTPVRPNTGPIDGGVADGRESSLR